MTLPSKPVPQIKFNPICLKPSFFPELLDAMVNGELLIDLCKRISDESVAAGGRTVKYSDVMGYIIADTQRTQAWNAAVKDGQSHLINTLISELKAVSTIDVKDMFEKDGSLRPIDDIPFNLRRVIAGIEVAEIWKGEGRDRKVVGTLKKVKLTDKLKAIEMLGKQLNMFVDKIVVSGSVQVHHSVEQFDLDARLEALRSSKTKKVTVTPSATVEDATIIEKEAVPVEVSRGGEDI